MSEWTECTLSEVADVIPGFAFKGEHFGERGVTVIKIKDITPPTISIDGAQKVDLANYSISKLEKYKLENGDYVVAMTGATIGKVGRLLEEADVYINQRVAKIEPKSGVDRDFVYFSLIDSAFDAFVQNNIDSHSAQENISGTSIGRYPIILPQPDEQKAIAAVLSSLDNKIDLLHRQNKTLEAMVASLFRQRFVEEAQEDWEEVKLSAVCSVITKGTTPTTLGRQFVEAGVNFVKAESITDGGDFIREKFAKISEETHLFLKRSIIESGDVLCSIAGTIGRVAIVDDSILPANTNQAIAILRADREKCLPEFIYLFLKSAAFLETMDGKIVHAVQPNLSLGEIGNTAFRLPPHDVLQKFKRVILPIFEKKTHNARQLQTLEKLRDTLLPKLMSGEIRIQDA